MAQQDSNVAHSTGGFEEFKRAMERGQRQACREQGNRVARYNKFNDAISGASDEKLERAERRFFQREAQSLLAKCRAWTTDAFDPVRVLGEGGFGVVHLVKRKSDDRHFALKQMEKAVAARKNRKFAFQERDALAEARSRWCVKMFATFQDDRYAYQLMEFLPGGDLLFHLERMKRFPSSTVAFYTAELLEALAVVHGCGLVHRDIKPDNLVLGPRGHLKLLDFGLCRPRSWCECAKAPAHDVDPRAQLRPSAAPGCAAGPSSGAAQDRKGKATACGTLEYMAPEVFERCDVGPEMDIWSAGIVAFECLVGTAPFLYGRKRGDEAFEHMKQQMMIHDEILDARLQNTRSKGFTDDASERFLSRAICTKETRISIQLCRQEPFFAGLDFDQLHKMEPPIKPQVSSPGDASNFEDFEAQELPQAVAPAPSAETLEWAGYDFDREACKRLSCSNIDVDALFASHSTASRSSRDSSSCQGGSRQSASFGSCECESGAFADQSSSAVATSLKVSSARAPAREAGPGRRALGGA